MPPVVLGFHGKRRSGKDTAAALLASEHTIAFAKPLKDAARDLCGFTDEQLYGDDKEVAHPFWGFSAREFLQRLGTALAGEFGADFLVRRTDQVFLAEQAAAVVAFTDVRFPPEAAYVRARGGSVVCVKRPAAEATDQFSKHASEQELAPEHVDFYVDNDGTLEQFRERLRLVVARVQAGGAPKRQRV